MSKTDVEFRKSIFIYNETKGEYYWTYELALFKQNRYLIIYAYLIMNFDNSQTFYIFLDSVKDYGFSV